MKKILWIMIALFSTGSIADDMQGSLGLLCKKIQQCALAQAGATENKDMQALLRPMLSAMCRQMEQSYTVALEEQPHLKTDALTCVQSLESLSCGDLLNQQGNQYKTKACEAFRSKAEAN